MLINFRWKIWKHLVMSVASYRQLPLTSSVNPTYFNSTHELILAYRIDTVIRQLFFRCCHQNTKHIHTVNINCLISLAHFRTLACQPKIRTCKL